MQHLPGSEPGGGRKFRSHFGSSTSLALSLVEEENSVALHPEVMASSSSGGHDGSTRVNFDSLLQSNVTLGGANELPDLPRKQVFGKRYLETAKQR